jgi:hypothetical protein
MHHAQPLVLFCKSYRDDVLRARRLAESVQQFNADSLPFYMSVPASDLPVFREKCAGLKLELIADEDIVAANPRLDRLRFDGLPGGIRQQIVKSEFWRLGIADAYLCLDSDCYFIRNFNSSDFISRDGVPYTVMDEAKELLHFAELSGMRKIARDWQRESEDIKRLFGRTGKSWHFGPIPVIWSSRVWKDLDERFLKPRGMTMIDAINTHPSEMRWYGEALLAFGGIPILPIEPIFRCYHYEEQFYFWKERGETEEKVAVNYLGVCMQSNWNKDLDPVRRFKFSSWRRRIKRALFGA